VNARRALTAGILRLIELTAGIVLLTAGILLLICPLLTEDELSHETEEVHVAVPHAIPKLRCKL
jgi:hypothetical protein